MKIYVGPYRSWFGGYQLAELLLFWKDKHEDPIVHKFGTWLADTPIHTFLEWIHSKKKIKVKIKIHDYDVWGMDSTLARVILPMLVLLHEKKHGAPFVDDEDVPDHLKSTSAPPKENEYDTDQNHFLRWDWVMSELIWTFTQLHPDTDWEDQYHTGVHDIRWKTLDSGMSQMFTGPNDTHVFDMEGWKKHQDRINNGTRLFGQYYSNLWD